ncbi:Mss4-like protein [Stachybotrys elegans]|uniref:Mss4-like protein n=1 Tax=Stachybotrys elegans TaxID=80388 RepID=A0A8K0WNR1_9HYPO|nr:Mss4-like protein [Stachybotrys elegans]
MASQSENKPSKVYECGCHCGRISFSMKLSPGLDEYVVLDCNCSICRRAGYLLVYPAYEDVTWHNDSRSQCSVYEFNTKTKDHLFCPSCGASIGLDFRERNPREYGISVRTINNIDLNTLKYRKSDGVNKVHPPGDLSGQEHAPSQE